MAPSCSHACSHHLAILSAPACSPVPVATSLAPAHSPVVTTLSFQLACRQPPRLWSMPLRLPPDWHLLPTSPNSLSQSPPEEAMGRQVQRDLEKRSYFVSEPLVRFCHVVTGLPPGALCKMPGSHMISIFCWLTPALDLTCQQLIIWQPTCNPLTTWRSQKQNLNGTICAVI